MITDQRYNPRLSIFMGGDIYKNPHGDKLGRTIIRDISVSGMRIETLDGLAAHETVYVDFDVAGKFQFAKVPARVTRIFRHMDVFLAGLCFLDGHDKRRVHQALSYVLEDSL